MDPRYAATEADEAGGEDAPAPTRLGHFELGRQLGAGGMGVVFEARDTRLDRTVAIKLLHPERRHGGNAQVRLLREAQALARLSHPNVVTVFEVGTVGDDLFIAMELIEGATLREWTSEPRDWRAVVDMFVAAGRGLAAVHALGLVHRDFKPSNVLVDARGVPKVSDFGLVAIGEDSSSGGAPPAIARDITETGSVVGTPAYMAPEQQRGDRTDARSDQYSFARSLAEALRAPPPAALRPILARALAHEPSRRYPSMDALLADLMRARRSNAAWWIAGGAGAAALGAIAIAWTLGRSRAAAADPCPAPDEAAAAIWGDARRGEVGAHLAAVDRAQGAARFAAATARLEPYLRDWRAMHVDACRATRVRGAQSDSLLDQRMHCLELRRVEADASVAALAGAADPAALDAAVEGLADLTPLSYCADAGFVARADLPTDPEARAAVDALAARLQVMEVDLRANRFDGLDARSVAAVTDARAIVHLPSLASALMLRSKVLAGLGRATDAVTVLREATQVAAQAHAYHVEALAWIALIGTVGWDLGQTDEALALVPAASAAVLRAGDPVELRTLLLYSHATLLTAGPRSDEGLALLDEATRLLEQARASQPGPQLTERLAWVIEERASALHYANRIDESIALRRRAIELIREYAGPDSADEAMIHHNLAETFRIASRLDDALASAREAARIREARIPGSPQHASDLVTIAAIQNTQGNPAEALATYDRALAMYRVHLGPDDPQIIPVLTGRASALKNTGRTDDALAAYAELIDLIERTGTETRNLPIALSNRGELYTANQRCADALPDYQRAVREFERLATRIPYYLIHPLVGQGRCLVLLGRAVDALAPLERAVSIDTGGNAALHYIQAEAWLGRALLESRRDRTRGLALLRKARASFAAFPGSAAADELADVDAWLAKWR